MLKDKYILTFIIGVALQSIYIIGIAISSEHSSNLMEEAYAPAIFFSCLFMIVGFMGMFGMFEKILNKFKKGNNTSGK